MDKNAYFTYKIGIDEVGRGPIAGPVCVCSFLTKGDSFLESCTNIEFLKKEKLPKLRDSKKLSKKQREEWFKFLHNAKKNNLCDFSISFVSSENIDKFGIAKCIQKALDESLKKVISQIFLEDIFIFLDGGLKAKNEYINQQTIIKGDELHPVISLASIVAKVSRDKIMEKYSKEYPEYGFEKHSGYGTKVHYEAIKNHGQTPIHRKSFIH